jgi:hypothetical protein
MSEEVVGSMEAVEDQHVAKEEPVGLNIDESIISVAENFEEEALGRSDEEREIFEDDGSNAPIWLKNLALQDPDKKGLEKFKNVEELAKSYKALESKLGEHPIPVASPEDYEWHAPEGSEMDEALDGEFRALAHGLGITQDQFKGLQDFAAELAKRVDDQNQSYEETVYHEAEKELTEEWGHELEARLEDARKGLLRLGGEDGLDWATEAGLDNDPKFIRMMARVGDAFREHKFYEGTPTVGIDSAKSKIANIMGDLTHPYHDEMHPGHKVAVDEMAKYYQIVYGIS